MRAGSDDSQLEPMDLAGEDIRIKAFSASFPYCYAIMGVLRDPQPMDVAQ
jgi:hypothetical protein